MLTFDESLHPMLCNSLEEQHFDLLLFKDPSWVAEMKYDGRRGVLILRQGEVPELWSRPGKRGVNHNRWQSLAWALHVDPKAPWTGLTQVLDVEIIDPSDAPRSSVAGRYLTNETQVGCEKATQDYGSPKIVVLDVLVSPSTHHIEEGSRLRERLLERPLATANLNSWLMPLCSNSDRVKFPTAVEPLTIKTKDEFDTDKNLAISLGREGYVFKKLTSVYDPGARSRLWLKYKFGYLAKILVSAVEYDKLTACSQKVDGLYTNKRTAGRVHKIIGTCYDITGYNPGPSRKVLDKGVPVEVWGASDEIRDELEALTGGPGKEGVVELPFPREAYIECNGIDKERLRHPRFDRWINETPDNKQEGSKGGQEQGPTVIHSVLGNPGSVSASSGGPDGLHGATPNPSTH